MTEELRVVTDYSTTARGRPAPVYHGAPVLGALAHSTVCWPTERGERGERGRLSGAISQGQKSLRRDGRLLR